MKPDKLKHLTIDDFSGISSYVIDNFILYGPDTFHESISLKDVFSFNGVIHGTCLQGKGKLRINFREYEIAENTIITIFPNQVIEGIEDTRDCVLQLMAFTLDFSMTGPKFQDYELLKKIIDMPVLHITTGEMDVFQDYYSFIVKNFHKKKHMYTHDVIKSLVFSLFLEIFALYQEKEIAGERKRSNRWEELSSQFFTLLRENYKQYRFAGFYAEKLHVTPKYLSSVLKMTTGKSINAWIVDTVMMSAKMYLKTTDMTILQISEELNFPNSSYFGRFFKKYTHMTPMEYRMKG